MSERVKCSVHCTACRACFSGVAAFEAHRIGSPDSRHCADPAKHPRLVAKTGHGTCKLGWPGETREVTLWALAASVDVAERFAA